MKKVRIGVFVCHCGLNIAKSVNVKALREQVSRLHGVIYAVDYEFMCSETGQKIIREAIKEHKLNRVVVASCSPKLHELTFRRVVKEAGLNPFLFEMANIREHCSWAHLHEPEKATKKAVYIVKSAVERCKYLDEIGEKEEFVKPSALVIGGGIAGVTAAVSLADFGFEVHLVEKSPWLGGKVAQLGKAFPTEDCGVCVTPRLFEVDRKCFYKSQILSHPQIKTYTLSTLRMLTGYIGHFTAQIEKMPRYVSEKLCIACGECEKVCPVEVSSEFDLGLRKRKAIYLPFIQAVPHIYALDINHCTKCGECMKVCPTDAINLEEKPSYANVEVGTIIVAVGFDEFEPTGMFGYANYQNVMTQLKLARMMDSSGPTLGNVVRPSDGNAPKNIVLLQCVGSRDKATHIYCSKICCTIALKHARSLKMMNPKINVTICYKDLRPFGRNYEEIYTDCQKLGINFIHCDAKQVTENLDKSLRVNVSLATGEEKTIDADMLVLSSAFVPPKDIVQVSRTLNLSSSPDGFLMELHPKLAPIDTNMDGIYICGACQGPKDIQETVTQALGAVARATAPMAAGKIKIDLAKAIVDENLCIGCANCVAACPYNAIEMEPSGIARVIEIACKGCGVCAAECPARAMQLRHFTDKQLFAAVEGILGE